MKLERSRLSALLGLLTWLALPWCLGPCPIPPAHAKFVPLTSLAQVEERTGFRLPADSTLDHGVYRPQWSGVLYCKVRLSPAGLTQLKSELSFGEQDSMDDRLGFTQMMQPDVAVDPEVYSSREFWIVGGGQGGSVWTMMVVNDDKNAPAAFVYWGS